MTPEPTVCPDCRRPMVASTFGGFVHGPGDWERCRFRKALAELESAIAEADRQNPTITLLADLLDGVMQDDPQAIRDAAAWLATNRPEQETA